MKTRPFPIIAFLVMLCVFCGASLESTACPVGVASKDGSWSFSVAPGGSQVKVIVLGNGDIDPWIFHMATNSDEFILDSTTIVVPPGGEATITLTFRPHSTTTGTAMATLTGGCHPITLTGIVETAAVVTAGASPFSVSVSPNPATSVLTVKANGARSAEITIFDILGKVVAQHNEEEWNWDVSRVPTGCYVVRVEGVSMIGTPFVESKRVLIER